MARRTLSLARPISIYWMSRRSLRMLPGCGFCGQELRPDSPPVILIHDGGEASAAVAVPPLVDAVLSARLSAEALREQLMHWLRLQASNKRWLATANPASQPEAVVDDVAQCAIAKLQLSAQLQSELLSSLFEALSQGVFLCDQQGTLLAANEAFLQLTGYHCEELLGHPSAVLPMNAQGELAADFWRLIHERSRWEGETSACRKGGRSFHSGCRCVTWWLNLRRRPRRQRVIFWG